MKYHLIGDQGVSMRGIKKYLESLGHTVTGSDLKTGGHRAENIQPDIDVVVRTSAVNPGSDGWVEVERANELGIKVVKRSVLLGQLTANKKLIAVSGMHGKTTVTSMIGLILTAAGLDPTVMVGEEVKEFDDVLRIGQSDLFVLEACEYDRSFLDFYPQYLVLTNIEAEHLDTYPGGLPEIEEAFLEYINHVPDDGVIVACKDDENLQRVLAKRTTKARLIEYGFTAESNNKLEFEPAVPGKHNILDALAAKAIADSFGVEDEVTKGALSKFQGAHRRLELKGQYKGALLYDDYGHHPTEIRMTIAALKEKYPKKRLAVVFWPHQYKRIKPLLQEFAKAFVEADFTIIKPIFFVPGRDEILDISSQDLVALAKKNHTNAVFLETDEEIVDLLRLKLDQESILLTIGIPPVYKIAETLAEAR